MQIHEITLRSKKKQVDEGLLDPLIDKITSSKWGQKVNANMLANRQQQELDKVKKLEKWFADRGQHMVHDFKGYIKLLQSDAHILAFANQVYSKVIKGISPQVTQPQPQNKTPQQDKSKQLSPTDAMYEDEMKGINGYDIDSLAGFNNWIWREIQNAPFVNDIQNPKMKLVKRSIPDAINVHKNELSKAYNTIIDGVKLLRNPKTDADTTNGEKLVKQGITWYVIYTMASAEESASSQYNKDNPKTPNTELGSEVQDLPDYVSQKEQPDEKITNSIEQVVNANAGLKDVFIKNNAKKVGASAAAAATKLQQAVQQEKQTQGTQQ